MKLDKETIIAIVVCIAFLFAYPVIVKKIWPGQPKTNQTVVKEGPAKINPNKPEDPKKIPEKQPDNTVSVKDPEIKKPEKKPENAPVMESEKGGIQIAPDLKINKTYSIENEFIVAAIDPDKGNVSSIRMNKYNTTVADGRRLKKSDVNIMLLENVKNGALGVTPGSAGWILTEKPVVTQNDKKSITVARKFKTAKGEKFQFTQNWEIISDYVIENSIEIKNLSDDTPLSLQDVHLSVGGIPKISILAGDQVFREIFEVDYYDTSKEKIVSTNAAITSGFLKSITGGAKKKVEGINQTVTAKALWIGVVNKYFTCILRPEKPFENGFIEKGVVLKNKSKREYVMAEAVALLDFENIAPDASQSKKFKYYAGPKKLDKLKKFEPTSTKIMKLYLLGMSFLEFISVGFVHMLNWLQSLCGSYGLSIILLTLIVKTVFWPVTHKANVSMRKMQKIQPLIKELRKKYKDKSQQMNMEMMKLYKEHKVNPLGGCLPILLQMPIFFALYAAFSGTIAPRHECFLWAKDLSMPDTVGYIFGLPINPLMLMMTTTMILQQKLTPSAADPAQKKMMMFMPLIMLLMLYSLPSGLTLYWTVSQFISVSQLIVNKHLEKRSELREAGAL